MWIDETGGAEATDTGHDGELEISVEGQTYSAEENFDIDHDGHDDAVRLDNEDGTMTAYVDSDGDGQADEYLHTDTEGNVVEAARFDSATGEWVASGEPGTTDAGSDAGHQGDLTADLADGTVDLGHATVDSDNDGTADTAVVTDADGNTRLFTDTDGDGSADVQTIITPEGESHTYEHTGHGEWTETAGSGVRADSDALWGAPGRDTVEGVARIDSGTGQWISQN
ncbi:hypothetical protein FHX82_000164 [Amycolatopsis bartoniae]|uniref:DUF6802 domain-containing protein n=1 Tax=Amycolatopsis bartoniae TaxID=941986 RepID=A0A8H9IXM5_9PSEU|nr:DUF6802 family protein [Amycolatopsis bartoniae]MBB2933144.1 hypothetical protein [Amycolatopsis bartoniae]TVT11862.1 hypothetical protein FNH07_00615 [Amycolatopsis bartoniae]GHF57399.1 hypothetical protein GCM10017566_33250 [Amycolatopsis bartoniae]